MGERRDAPGVAVLPPLAWAVMIGLAVLLEWAAPLGVLPPPLVAAAAIPGALLIAASVALSVWAMTTFRRAGTSLNVYRSATALVSAGPYRFTRNPMYLGMIVFQLGLGLVASLDWAVVLTPALWAVLQYGVVLREEAYLRRRFGADYEGLLARTRRWL